MIKPRQLVAQLLAFQKCEELLIHGLVVYHQKLQERSQRLWYHLALRLPAFIKNVCTKRKQTQTT